MTFVVVTGQPGAGKSTLARPLAARLRLPLLAKDTVKEALSVLDDPATLTVDRSRALGAASFEVVFALASGRRGAVLEASWDPMLAGPRLAALPAPVVEVHCACPPEIARRRYESRAKLRHWVHLDVTRIRDDKLWSAPGPHDLSDPVVVVDTTGPVDLDGLVKRLVEHPGRGRERPTATRG